MSDSMPEVTSYFINVRITVADNNILERMAPTYISGRRNVSRRIAWLIAFANDLAKRHGVEIVDGRERPTKASYEPKEP